MLPDGCSSLLNKLHDHTFLKDLYIDQVVLWVAGMSVDNYDENCVLLLITICYPNNRITNNDRQRNAGER